MSSAIEVLKKAQSDIDTDVYIAWSEIEAIEIHNALSEALLALEKQEKLNRWLEKEIETYSKVSNLIPNDYLSEQSLIIYKKVLNKLEGKA